MCMGLFIARILAVLLASLYFFPLNLSFLPADLNSKKLMAAIGLAVFVIESVRNRALKMDKGVFACLFYACLVSLAGVLSVVLNHTGDMTYATYITSMAVWLAAAYLVVFVIRKIEGKADVLTLGQYFVAVCIFQCVSALLIDNVPAFKTWALSWMTGFGFTGIDSEASRMFGLGAFLDVGGTRFAAGLVILGALIKDAVTKNQVSRILLGLFCFIFILVVGSMIGRTTFVGALFALVYWIITSDLFRFRPSSHNTVLKWIVGILIILVPVAIALYNRNPYFHDKVRFGFENFFNWFENGQFTSGSTNRLMTMFVWPDNMKTWLIGDGYFNGPGADPNFLGNAGMTAYYMWTDVGYCRFIFYFGLLGLGLFMLFFIRVGVACGRKQPGFKLMFALLVLLNFVIWIKVATDIFVILAPFLCLDLFEKESSDETDISPELDI